MPHFKTPDEFYDDPAVVQAGTAAMGLYYRCGLYVAKQLLDGFIPSAVASQYGTPEWVKKLTDACLWETVPGGHFMPLYFAHGNPTREKVLAGRKAKAERQARWLANKRRVSRPSSSASAGTARDGSGDDALPPSLTGRKGGGRANGAAPPPSPRNQPLPARDAIAAAIPPGNRPLRGADVAAIAAQARAALRTRPEVADEP